MKQTAGINTVITIPLSGALNTKEPEQMVPVCVVCVRACACVLLVGRCWNKFAAFYQTVKRQTGTVGRIWLNTTRTCSQHQH